MTTTTEFGTWCNHGDSRSVTLEATVYDALGTYAGDYDHDAIASEFGREAAEKALVVTASVLRSAITDTDVAARVDSHEFAILLEGPTTPATANECAQQVVARGLQQSDALPLTATLRFHIAVAMLPDMDFDSAGSLKWLSDGVRAIDPQARRAIRPLNF